MSGQRPIALTVNGSPVAAHIARSTTLLELLRDRLGLTGVKDGCSQGDCGCCTVVLNGEATKACLVNAAKAHGADVLTIEGLSQDGRPHPLQQAFVEAGAVQCGYCTPGQVMAAAALLRRNPSPTRQQVLEALSAVLCRCTGYIKVADAVLLAAARLRGEGAPRPAPAGNGRGLRVVGTPLVLRGAMERALGSARYAGDRRRDGMVFAQVLRSPHHHARILRIDAAAARALPGVLDVITAADFPLNRLCLFDKSFIDPNATIDLPLVPDLFGAKNIGGVRIPAPSPRRWPAGPW